MIYTIGDIPEHDPVRYRFEQSCDDDPYSICARPNCFNPAAVKCADLNCPQRVAEQPSVAAPASLQRAVGA